MSSTLTAAIDEVAEVPVGSSTDAGLGTDLVDIQAAIARLEAQWLRRLAVFDARDGSAADGALSTAAWLRARCRLAPGAATERVGLARALREAPVTEAALAAGSIGYRPAVLVAGVVTEVRARLGAEPAAAAEATLVGAARAWDPARLRQLVTSLRQALVPAVVLTEANDAYDRRYLDVSATFEGMVAVNGMLDAEGGASLLAALGRRDRDGRPAGTGQARSPGQARADALVALARAGLDAGRLPELAGERPHLTITADVATVAGLAARGGGTADWVGAVTAETVRRLGCDASLTRVLLAGPSEVLDVGRRTRVVSPAQRRALVVRDGGCRFPGCDRPPWWTDAHHLLHWADGGPTDLANLVLLCRGHHRLLREGGWALAGDPAGELVAGPPEQRSRRAGRPPPGVAA